MENKLKRIWLLICILGMVIQNVFVTIEYFKYTTTTEVIMEIEEEFYPPAFTVCFPIKDLVMVNELPKGHGCRNSSIGCNIRSFSGFPLKDIMTKYSLNFTSTVQKIAFDSGDMNGMTEYYSQNMSKFLVEFYADGRKCLRVSLGNINRKLSTSRISSLSKDSFLYLLIYGKEGFKRYFEGHIVGNLFHPSNTFPRGFHIEMYTEVFRNYSNMKEFTYLKSRFNYLHPPFFSMCFDYYKSRIESREDCIEQCIKKRLEEPNLALRQLTYLEKEWTSKAGLKLEIDFNQTRLFELYDTCHKECPLGCHTLYYEPILIFKRQVKSDLSYIFAISLMKLARELTFSAKFDILSYVIYIASVCSLWLGFVIFDSIILTIPFIVKHFHKSRSNVVNLQQNITLNMINDGNNDPNRISSIEI